MTNFYIIGTNIGLTSFVPRTKQNLTLRVTSPTSDFGQNCQPKEVNISQALDLAAQEYNAGSLHEAENIYQQILQADPDNPSALQILGVVAYQGGRAAHCI